MNQWIANAITAWSLGAECEKDSDRFQIVSYGILLIIETVYKVIVLMILGEIIGSFPETIAFLVGFSGLRKNAGGFHMKTSWGCMLSVLGFWLISLALSMISLNFFIRIVIFLLTVTLVAYFSPCATPNNPISDKNERLKKRIFAMIYTVLFSCIANILYLVGYVRIAQVLIISMLIESLTIIHKVKGEKV